MVQDPFVRKELDDIGGTLGPHVINRIRALFLSEQEALALSHKASAVDVAYGEHSRHRLDIYTPMDVDAAAKLPIIVWVHGGGFVRGDKNEPEHPFEAHIGRFVASAGFLGVVINYRLAPEVKWPSGGEDLESVIRWLKSRASDYGGDPERIVLMGTSAGAMHISTYLRLFPVAKDIKAAVILSGLFGYTPLDDRDRPYYEGVEETYLKATPLADVMKSDLPIFIACAQYDPPRFQSEFVSFLAEMLEFRGVLPDSFVASGHNHYSLAFHIGSSDTRLSDEVMAFARRHCDLERPSVSAMISDDAQPAHFSGD